MSWYKDLKRSKLNNLLCLCIFIVITESLPANTYLEELITQKDSLLELSPDESRDSALMWTYLRLADEMAYQQHPGLTQILTAFEILCNDKSWPLCEALYTRAKAKAYTFQGKNTEAYDHYLKAIEQLEKLNIDPYEMAMTYSSAGFLIFNSGLREKGLEMLEKAYAIAEKAKNKYALYQIIDFYGDYNYYSAFQIEDFSKALEYYKEARKLIDEHDFNNELSDNLHGMADVYFRLGKDSLAQAYWDQSFELAIKNNDYGVIYALYVDLAEILDTKGKRDEANEKREAAYEYALKNGWLEYIGRAADRLYWGYREQGNFEKALYYFEKYTEVQDSMKKSDMQKRYNELEALYENDRKERMIAELNLKNLRQTRNFLGGIVALILLLSTVVIIANRRLHAKNEELIQKNNEIIEAHVSGQTIERKRLAAELHDNLNTKIAAVRWQLQALEGLNKGDSKKIIDNSLSLVNDIYSDVRLIAHNLMPEEIESKGLISAIGNLVNNLNHNNRVQFHLVSKDESINDLGEMTYPIYNISFELINNVLKHSEANNAWISLSKSEKTLTISVSDDGSGFDPDKIIGGVGLKNIRSRVEKLGGTLHIDSKDGQGSKIVVKIDNVN